MFDQDRDYPLDGPATRANPPPKPGFGNVVSATSRPTSKIEEGVKDFLRVSGFHVPRGQMGVICQHPDRSGQNLILAPDIVLRDLRLAIEVDPCGPGGRYGYSHAGAEEKDRTRNVLLAAVGWSVIRLRLGATEGAQIGDRDLIIESSGFTKAAQVALLEAIEDHREKRPPRLRFVPKGKTPAAGARRSHVVNIGPDRYSDDTYWFTWYPVLDEAENHKYRLAVGGRYLYARIGDKDFAFVAEVGLDQVDRANWRARLTEYLADNTPTSLKGTTKWPWGDMLLIPAMPADQVSDEIIEASDHDKQNIDRIGFQFTVSGDHIGSWTSETLRRADETVIATIHPAAAALGYRFVEVSLDRGWGGPYQRIKVSRAAA